MPSPPLACIGRREEKIKSFEMQKKGIPLASDQKNRKRRRKEFLLLGFGGPPPSTPSYLGPLLINFLCFTMMMIPFPLMLR
jgi:hypothetical protein